MRVSHRTLAVATSLLILCLSTFATAQLSDEAAAERAFGPQWKHLSRRAGMIFAGTVLAAAGTDAQPDRVFPATTSGPLPAIQLSFRVDEAIAGVEPGEVLTIHEWAGAWSMHRPMLPGQHILIFLYRPGRLGLTSPVGGSLGQIGLDSSGKNVLNATKNPTSRDNITVVQLEHAIRSARSEAQ
jgi:hypothetical protein